VLEIRAPVEASKDGMVVSETVLARQGARAAILVAQVLPAAISELLQTKMAANRRPAEGLLKANCWMESCGGRGSLSRRAR
jgi:hypothetical protein